MNKSDILCRLWTLEYSRTTGRTDRRMTYAKGWYHIESVTEGEWSKELGSNYQVSTVERMVETLKGRPSYENN